MDTFEDIDLSEIIPIIILGAVGTAKDTKTHEVLACPAETICESSSTVGMRSVYMRFCG